ncbi:hypothetical protein [Planobispora longispora]|uniref:Uncharacterized protein n=1 Tax=Planobispora longispora TaxID=28887 RepID=A0A8J3RFV6_9ACTN|nr:hypothetical protein [Planobispora longispora]GIH73935.1 hypothetical protein Plo01_03640 [Planobispora longispora]
MTSTELGYTAFDLDSLNQALHRIESARTALMSTMGCFAPATGTAAARPAGYGRIFESLHVLTYVDDEPYRCDIKAMRKHISVHGHHSLHLTDLGGGHRRSDGDGGPRVPPAPWPSTTSRGLRPAGPRDHTRMENLRGRRASTSARGVWIASTICPAA